MNRGGYLYEPASEVDHNEAGDLEQTEQARVIYLDGWTSNMGHSRLAGVL